MPMNFKPALCPSCGGKMQIPDDVNTVKCMYCGVDVIVREAIRLAGRTKEFTQATAIEKIDEWKPFDLKSAKKRNYMMIFALGVICLSVAVCAGGGLGLSIAVTYFIFAPIIYFILTSNLKKFQLADIEMSQKGATVTLTGYKGQCPYCNTLITLKANSLGDNCPACHNRIVIRDSKFYSVETPVGGVEKNI